MKLWQAAILVWLMLSGTALAQQGTRNFSVATYGAIPDDGNSDTTAIQKAIEAAEDYAAANSTRATVFFPKGSYHITNLEVDRPNITLDGYDARLEALSGSGFNQMLLVTGEADSETAEYIVIKGLAIDGNYPTINNAGTGLGVNIRANHVKLLDVAVEATESDTFISQVCSDVTFERCISRDAGENGFRIRSDYTKLLACEAYDWNAVDSSSANRAILADTLEFDSEDLMVKDFTARMDETRNIAQAILIDGGDGDATTSGTSAFANSGVATTNQGRASWKLDVGHGFMPGDGILVSGTGQSAYDDISHRIYSMDGACFVGVVDANTFKLYDTAANAVTNGAAGRYNVTGSGTGDFYVKSPGGRRKLFTVADTSADTFTCTTHGFKTGMPARLTLGDRTTHVLPAGLTGVATVTVTTTFSAAGTSGDFLLPKRIKNVTLEDIKILHQAADTTDSSVIEVANVNNLEISRLRIQQNPPSGSLTNYSLQLADGLRKVTITDSVLPNGIKNKADSWIPELSVTKSEIGTGTYLLTDALETLQVGKLTVDSSVLRFSGAAIETASAASELRDADIDLWTITNNYFEGSSTSATQVLRLNQSSHLATSGKLVYFGNQRRNPSYTGLVFSAATTDIITATGHALETGDEVTVATTTTLPGGLSANTKYYARRTDDDLLTLHTTLTGASDNTARVDITSTGSGTHTLSGEKVGCVLTGSNDTSRAFYQRGMSGKEFVAPTVPSGTTLAYTKGDIIWQMNPVPGGSLGWLCTKTGTPGSSAGTFVVMADSESTYNVVNYGARPDDAVDDTTAIQAAIDAAEAFAALDESNHAIVYVPKGVYLVGTATLADDSGLNIGTDDTTPDNLLVTGDGTLKLAPASAADAILEVNGDYITVAELQFDGNESGVPTGRGECLRIQGDYCTARNIYAFNTTDDSSAGATFFINSEAVGTLIEGCTSFESGESGVSNRGDFTTIRDFRAIEHQGHAFGNGGGNKEQLTVDGWFSSSTVTDKSGFLLDSGNSTHTGYNLQHANLSNIIVDCGSSATYGNGVKFARVHNLNIDKMQVIHTSNAFHSFRIAEGVGNVRITNSHLSGDLYQEEGAFEILGTMLSATDNGSGFVRFTNSEVQTIAISEATLSTGTFTITHTGGTTSGIAIGASAATVQTALRLVSGLSSVTVTTNDSGNNRTYRVVMTGAGANPAEMTSSTAGLSGGSPVIAHATPGHGLKTGDVVIVTGTTSYNGVHYVTASTTPGTTFDTDWKYVASETGTFAIGMESLVVDNTTIGTIGQSSPQDAMDNVKAQRISLKNVRMQNFSEIGIDLEDPGNFPVAGYKSIDVDDCEFIGNSASSMFAIRSETTAFSQPNTINWRRNNLRSIAAGTLFVTQTTSMPYLVRDKGMKRTLLTANTTLTSEQSGTLFRVDTADLVITLPPVTSASTGASGLSYTFVLASAGLSSGTGLSLSPNSSDKIMGNGFSAADDEDIILGGSTDRAGDSITIVSDGVDGWYATSISGAWRVSSSTVPGSPGTIRGSADANLSSITNGQSLVWNSTTGKFDAATGGAGTAVTTPDGLTTATTTDEYNVKHYGASGSGTNYFGTTSTSGTTTVTTRDVAGTATTHDFVTGQGIAVLGAGPVCAVSAPSTTVSGTSSTYGSAQGTAYTWTFDGSSVITVNSAPPVIANGAPVRVSTDGTLPTGAGGYVGVLDPSTTYYLRIASATTFTLHASSAGAVANTGLVTLTGGSGTHTIVGYTEYRYTARAGDGSGGWSAASTEVSIFNWEMTGANKNYNKLRWHTPSSSHSIAIYGRGTSSRKLMTIMEAAATLQSDATESDDVDEQAFSAPTDVGSSTLRVTVPISHNYVANDVVYLNWIHAFTAYDGQLVIASVTSKDADEDYITFAASTYNSGMSGGSGRLEGAFTEWRDYGDTVPLQYNTYLPDRENMNLDWAANRKYPRGNIVLDSAGSRLFRHYASVPDSETGASEPTWPTGASSMVNDNDITWRREVPFCPINDTDGAFRQFVLTTVASTPTSSTLTLTDAVSSDISSNTLAIMHNDALAIRAARSAIVTAGKGGTLYFPAGAYNLVLPLFSNTSYWSNMFNSGQPRYVFLPLTNDASTRNPVGIGVRADRAAHIRTLMSTGHMRADSMSGSATIVPETYIIGFGMHRCFVDGGTWTWDWFNAGMSEHDTLGSYSGGGRFLLIGNGSGVAVHTEPYDYQITDARIDFPVFMEGNSIDLNDGTVTGKSLIKDTWIFYGGGNGSQVGLPPGDFEFSGGGIELCRRIGSHGMYLNIKRNRISLHDFTMRFVGTPGNNAISMRGSGGDYPSNNTRLDNIIFDRCTGPVRFGDSSSSNRTHNITCSNLQGCDIAMAEARNVTIVGGNVEDISIIEDVDGLIISSLSAYNIVLTPSDRVDNVIITGVKLRGMLSMSDVYGLEVDDLQFENPWDESSLLVSGRHQWEETSTNREYYLRSRATGDDPGLSSPSMVQIRNKVFSVTAGTAGALSSSGGWAYGDPDGAGPINYNTLIVHMGDTNSDGQEDPDGWPIGAVSTGTLSATNIGVRFSGTVEGANFNNVRIVSNWTDRTPLLSGGNGISLKDITFSNLFVAQTGLPSTQTARLVDFGSTSMAQCENVKFLDSTFKQLPVASTSIIRYGFRGTLGRGGDLTFARCKFPTWNLGWEVASTYGSIHMIDNEIGTNEVLMTADGSTDLMTFVSTYPDLCDADGTPVLLFPGSATSSLPSGLSVGTVYYLENNTDAEIFTTAEGAVADDDALDVDFGTITSNGPIIVRFLNAARTALQSSYGFPGDGTYPDAMGKVSGNTWRGSKSATYVLASDQNDYELIPVLDEHRFVNAAARIITGFNAPALGTTTRRLFIVNASAFNLTLSNNSGSSLTVNRILTHTGGDLVLAANDCCWLYYDGISMTWRTQGE